MTSTPNTPSKWGKSLALFVLAIVLVVAAILWNRSPATDPIAVQVSELAFEANGALENENFSVGKDEQGRLLFGVQEAIRRYEEILRLKPDEELPYRNLAIARLIAKRTAVQNNNPTTSSPADTLTINPEQASQQLVAAMEDYLNRFDSPVAKYLHGEVLGEFGAGTNQMVERVEKYFAAAQGEPDHAPFWYLAAWESSVLLASQSLFAQLENPDSLRVIQAKSLSELRRLCPNNLWVIRQSLVVMIQNKEPATIDYWQDRRPILEKAGFSSKNYVAAGRGDMGYYGDYSKEFDSLELALKELDWSKADSIMFGLDGGMKGKLPSVNDLAELQPNPLDYLLWQFSDKVTQAAQRQSSPAEAPNSIQFVKMDLPEVINDGGVVDFAFADVDFDGQLDLFVLRTTGIDVFRGPWTRDTDKPLFQIDVSGHYSSIQAGFLLTVGEASGSGIRRRLTEAAGHPPGIGSVELPQIILTGDDGLAVYELEWDATAGYTTKQIQQPDSTSSLRSIQKSLIVDFDQDADLDLVVITEGRLKLLMNCGNNSFLDASQWLYLPPDLGTLVDVQMVDWNRDLYMDLLVQSADGKIGLLDNERHGAFRYRSLEMPQSSDRVGFGVGELDGNASWDLISNSGSKVTVQFTETKAWSRVQWLAKAPGVDTKAGSLQIEGVWMGPWQLGDFDNSTTQDLLLWRDGQLHYHPSSWQGTSLAQGAQRWTIGEATASVPMSSRPSQGERGDFDNDGDLDVLVLVDGKLEFVRNDGGNQNPWLAIVPLGQGDNASRTNHLGIGSLMEVRIGPHYFAETITRPSVHVGLGSYERPNLARIIWTNGIPQTLLLPQGRQTIEMLCILKGSCPFIYTWDGQKWQFFSDCLWAAPIGLQSPGGGLVPTRNWEYLRLRPGTLEPTDGAYRVMLTEELWEVAYFDYVRLLAIDHPAEIEVHINDKVGPPEIVQHRLYQVSEKTLPKTATDHNGNDVLPLLMDEDNRYVKSFARRLTQGYVEPHDLILDFGSTDLEKQTLFLTGWIQPTDTSINVMLQQHPELPGPQFPALFVIGPDGQWQSASRPMGFPGGKTKTMAVPLTGLFPTADQRLKITGSSEIYWDQVYVSRDSEERPLQQIEAELVAAHSFYRGTSRRLPLHEHGPENFDANDVASESVWPPVSGSMTSFGDVLDLLSAHDDRLVTLGTGDAVELRFKVPETPIPNGYQRTFLLYTVGYDKDSDLHTFEGQRIEPLPTSDMISYPDYSAAPTIHQPNGHRQQNWNRFWRQIQNPQIPASSEETKVPRGDYRR
jgi:hypothetical protein